MDLAGRIDARVKFHILVLVVPLWSLNALRMIVVVWRIVVARWRPIDYRYPRRPARVGQSEGTKEQAARPTLASSVAASNHRGSGTGGLGVSPAGHSQSPS